VHASDVDGIALCQMFNASISDSKQIHPSCPCYSYHYVLPVFFSQLTLAR
jgi:hypothetical protein